MKIAITGATGQLGRLVVDSLKSKVANDNVIAVVRFPQNALNLGVEVRQADYNNPEILERALTDIDMLLLISGNEVGKCTTQHHNVIEAAKKNDVKYIIYTSILHADTSSVSVADEHRLTELKLKTAEIPFTLLRNGWYTENYIDSTFDTLAKDDLMSIESEVKIASAARVDFAEAAVVVLTSKGHEGKIYELTGDRAYTTGDLVAEILRQTCKSNPYINMRKIQFAASQSHFNLPKKLVKAMTGWNIDTSENKLYENNRQLSKLIGRPTTPLSVSIAKVLRHTTTTNRILAHKLCQSWQRLRDRHPHMRIIGENKLKL